MTSGSLRRILVIAGYWPTRENSITGVFVVQQVAAMARLGHKVTVLLTKTIGRDASPFLSVDELGLPPCRITIDVVNVARFPEVLSHCLGALKFNSALAGLCYSRKIKNLDTALGPFQGCFVHGARYASLSLGTWSKKLSCGVVNVIHGVDPLLNNLIENNPDTALLRASSERSKAVVLVGSPLKRYASALGVPTDKQVVVGNGTDIPDVTECHVSSYLKRDSVKLISVSNLIKLKGVDQNLSALSLVAERRPDLNFEYTIIGDGPERSGLKTLAVTLGISGRVRFLGRIPYAETMSEICDSDVFTLPSWGEAFGIVYLEAMARYKPVIGCYKNGAEDIFEHGKQGFLIKPHDINALSLYLERLIEDGSLRHTMGREGRITAERHTWEANAKKMLGLL